MPKPSPPIRTDAHHVEHPYLLTVRQVADVLAISERFVWTLIREGELGTVKIGRATRIPKADVDELVRTGRQPRSS